VVCQLAGIIGSVFTASSVSTWYTALQKPSLNPPSWVFGPVWTTLFVLMGIAAYLIYENGFKKKNVRIALSVFAVQLVLNTLWSILFFGLQNPGLALVEIAFLWLSILSCIVLFYKINKTAAYLLIPYIVWVSFASYLNYTLWILN
jgi:tryptophan-rich sensory protein